MADVKINPQKRQLSLLKSRRSRGLNRRKITLYHERKATSAKTTKAAPATT